MQVILLDNVENLGRIGDLVKVKPGFGRNYLLPQGKAALATAENIKAMESRRAELEKAAAEELAEAKRRYDTINGIELVITANAGTEEKLFGSVGPVDVEKALEKVQIEVMRSEIRMPDGPIHALGEYAIGVHLHPDVDAEVKLRIVAEE
jgi:large subunit ribosomal protein L9